jgi:hypothetical protein
MPNMMCSAFPPLQPPKHRECVAQAETGVPDITRQPASNCIEAEYGGPSVAPVARLRSSSTSGKIMWDEQLDNSHRASSISNIASISGVDPAGDSFRRIDETCSNPSNARLYSFMSV